MPAAQLFFRAAPAAERRTHHDAPVRETWRVARFFVWRGAGRAAIVAALCVCSYERSGRVQSITLGWLDYSILAIYVAFVVGIGFAIVAAPWVYTLSGAKGRVTFGDAGRAGRA